MTAGAGMAEKKGEDSSDSEAYLSADEVLAGSRGSAKDAAALDRLVYGIAIVELDAVACAAY